MHLMCHKLYTVKYICASVSRFEFALVRLEAGDVYVMARSHPPGILKTLVNISNCRDNSTLSY